MAPIPTAVRIAAEFEARPIGRIEPLGRGLINDTFLVTAAPLCFVLQCINARVFPDPAGVMANLRVLTDHAQAQPPDPDGFRLPGIIPTRTGPDFHRDPEGEVWRALHYIEGTRSLEVLEESAQAEQVGRALGCFHALTRDLVPELLHDTLPGFHITPEYLARFDRIEAQPRRRPDSPVLGEALEFVETRRDRADRLERARQAGEIRVRVIHGDPKLDNILFDTGSGRAVSLIDLDTVKPGLIHYDLGDCLRSCCNRAGKQGGESAFDLELGRAILRGYCTQAGECLTSADRDYLYDAIRLLPFELGLRFLTDHLEGDVYFKVAAPGQNLQRALAQFQLTESVERQEAAIRAVIRDLPG